MRTFWFVMTIGLFITLASGVEAGAQKYQLAFKDPTGTVRTYRMNLALQVTGTGHGDYYSLMNPNVEPMNQSQNVTWQLVETVLAAHDGSTMLSLAASAGKLKYGNPTGSKSKTTQTQKDLSDASYSYLRSPLGKVTEMHCISGTPQSNKASDGVFDSLTLVLPAKPVKIGDRWYERQSKEVGDFGFKTINAKVRTTYRLTGTEIIDGKTYLVITSEYDTGTCRAQQEIALDDMLKGQEDVADIKIGKITTFLKGSEKVVSSFLFDEQAGEIFRVVSVRATQLEMGVMAQRKTLGSGLFTMTYHNRIEKVMPVVDAGAK